MGVPGQLNGRKNQRVGKLLKCPKCNTVFEETEIKILSMRVVWKKCPNPKCDYVVPPKFLSTK
jgi:predicted Zn-ribbon and HTH transcriptional regulator